MEPPCFIYAVLFFYISVILYVFTQTHVILDLNFSKICQKQKKKTCRNPLHQESSTFQIVRATLTILMIPAGHKAILRHLEL
jgi:hypothetical protein